LKFGKSLKTVATQLKVVTSNMAFKLNQRYTSYVLSENKLYVFVTCRELTQVPTKNKFILKRVKRPLKELFLKCLFGGLNAYRYEEGISNLHVFSVKPFVLQYYQQLYKFIKLFLHYETDGQKIVKFNFFSPIMRFKKIRSVKKTLLKKQKHKRKQLDYTVIRF